MKRPADTLKAPSVLAGTASKCARALGKPPPLQANGQTPQCVGPGPQGIPQTSHRFTQTSGESPSHAIDLPRPPGNPPAMPPTYPDLQGIPRPSRRIHEAPGRYKQCSGETPCRFIGYNWSSIDAGHWLNDVPRSSNESGQSSIPIHQSFGLTQKINNLQPNEHNALATSRLTEDGSPYLHGAFDTALW